MCTLKSVFSCLISSFYIKPQQKEMPIKLQKSCLISSFYIKPQLPSLRYCKGTSCLISSFYIKPQHGPITTVRPSVVLYPLSTSNHNFVGLQIYGIWLSYILFLHQTTTLRGKDSLLPSCLISSFYIKPQRFEKR